MVLTTGAMAVQLEDLTLKECLLVSTRVRHDAARFFHTLATSLEPADPESTELLEHLAVDEASFEERLEQLDRQLPWSTVLHLDKRAIRTILHRHLPVLYRWVAVRRASPEIALKLAREIQREIADFHQQLARALNDEATRALLESFCEKERSHMARLIDCLTSTGAGEQIEA